MKYSNYIGIAAALGIISVCFLPWVYIESLSVTLTGVDTAQTNLGKPGLLNIIFSVVSIVLFSVSAVWSKRVNLFIAAFNMAWTIRNYLLVTQCQMGECPEKKYSMYLLLIFSTLLLLMSLIPKVVLRN